MENKTIAAISTPLAVGGIGIIRVSGNDAKKITASLFKPVGIRNISNVSGFNAIYGRVFDNDGDIDEVVVTVYNAPKSYTGEDVVEISCHGGIYVIRRILRACLANGAALARPGEFTKRAFLNGKINLTQAEAVIDLITAQSSHAAKAALSARDGVLSQKVGSITKILVACAGHLAAWVDYPEEDIKEITNENLLIDLENVLNQLNVLLSTYDTGRIIKQGVDTAIIGRPNVGKSTLMNLLAGFDRSIVTDIPGTTRDIVEDVINLEDVVLNLADTAGIRETDDPIELLGVSLSRKKLMSAGLVLAVFDSSEELNDDDKTLLDIITQRPSIAVVNKTDLPQKIDMDFIKSKISYIVEISAISGDGQKTLSETIKTVLGINHIDALAPVLANERQRDTVEKAVLAVNDAVSTLKANFTLDAVSVCIDVAIDRLLELTGERTTNEVVNEVFSHFCVGK